MDLNKLGIKLGLHCNYDPFSCEKFLLFHLFGDDIRTQWTIVWKAKHATMQLCVSINTDFDHYFVKKERYDARNLFKLI